MPRHHTGHKSMSLAFAVSDLRQRPEFFDVVADRIWQAWWKPHGRPLDYITGRLRENMNAQAIPLALVAHDGDRFLGTASVVASDLDERPQFSPWVAAVWVEPDARGHGIGAALVDHATEATFSLGVRRVYLCARRERSAFYQRLGWHRIEENVGPFALDVYTRDDAGLSCFSRSPP
jgi:GNAT superfamily N-acetyltransferase